MKVTFVLPGRGRSGGIRSTVKAANGLVDKGHDVRLLVSTANSGSIRIKTASLWLKYKYPHGADWVDMFKSKVESFKDISGCCFDKSEIVIASGWWAAGEIKKLNSKDITKVHHVRGMLRNPNDMSRYWSENVPKIVVGSYLVDIIKKTCNQNVYAVIHNGIDPGEYYPVLPEAQRNSIGTIFGLSYQKDPQTVLSVLNYIWSDHIKAETLVFGSCRKPPQIPSGIYYRLPSIELARQLYSRSLVWFLASSSEGFPAPPLEAMACGCAVVSTDCGGGVRDIIEDGYNGFIVPVGNSELMVKRIGQLLNDSQLRKYFVINSQETVKNFSWQSSINKLEQALLSLT